MALRCIIGLVSFNRERESEGEREREERREKREERREKRERERASERREQGNTTVVSELRPWRAKHFSHVRPCVPATDGLLQRGRALKPGETKKERERERELELERER